MLKRLKSLFIIEEDDDTKNVGSVEHQKVEESHQEEVQHDLESGDVNDKFLTVLARAIEASNQEGFDYFEFREFIKALNKFDMDEPTKFKSAFANAQTMGANLQNLKDSAEHYLNVLNREKGKFEEAVERRRSEVLDKRKGELGQMQQSIVDKQKMIKKLSQEIDELNKKIVDKQDQIETAEEKVRKTRGDFMTTYQHFVEEIQSDIQKIHTYLS